MSATNLGIETDVAGMCLPRYSFEASGNTFGSRKTCTTLSHPTRGSKGPPYEKRRDLAG